jgi:hypothetical protein
MKDEQYDMKSVDERFNLGQTLINSRTGLFPITARNLCTNFNILTPLQKKCDISFKENEEKGRPAIVFASGPTLDYGMDLLKEKLTKDFVKICGPTQLWNLERNGIRPDYVVSVDPRPDTGRYLNTRKMKGYKIVTHPHASPGTYKYADPHKLRVFLPKVVSPGYQHGVSEMRMQDFINKFEIREDETVGIYLKDSWLVLVHELTEATFGVVNHQLKYPIKIRLHAGGCSPVQAAIAAFVMGCDPIYYMGLDLCYWRNLGRSTTLLPSGREFKGYEKRDLSGAAPTKYDSACGWHTTEEMLFYKFAALQISHIEGMHAAEIVVDREPGNLQHLPRVDLEDLTPNQDMSIFKPAEEQREIVYDYIRSLGIGIKETDHEEKGVVHMRDVPILPGEDSNGSA